MKYLFILCSLFLATSSFAQSVNQQRMNRDIEVAENIINTLLEQEQETTSSSYILRSDGNVEGYYLDGYGLIFSTSPNFPFAVYTTTTAPKSPASENVIIGSVGKTKGYTFKSDAVSIYTGDASEDGEVILDSLLEAKTQQFKEVAQRYFTDYAYLIGQLDADDKIMLRSDKKGNNFFGSRFQIAGISGVRANNSPIISAEVNVSDVQALQNGKLSKNQFIDRIRYTESKPDEEVAADIKLVASVFERLYDRDLSEIFTRQGNCNYQRIDGLGAIYYLNFSNHTGLRFNSPTGIYFNRGLGRIEVQNGTGSNVIIATEKEKEKEEPAEVIEDTDATDYEGDYQKFMAQFMESMIEYGRMAKSLSNDEMLIFRLDFSGLSCESCDEKPELSVKASVLKDFDAGKITLDNAIEQIKVSSTNE